MFFKRRDSFGFCQAHSNWKHMHVVLIFDKIQGAKVTNDSYSQRGYIIRKAVYNHHHYPEKQIESFRYIFSNRRWNALISTMVLYCWFSLRHRVRCHDCADWCVDSDSPWSQYNFCRGTLGSHFGCTANTHQRNLRFHRSVPFDNQQFHKGIK